MDDFIERVQHSHGYDADPFMFNVAELDINLFKDIIMPEYTLMKFEVGNQCNQFMYYLCATLAKPKYDIIRHQLELSKYIKVVTKDDQAWMDKYMPDNWCCIEIPDFKSINNILDKVKTSLEPNIWKCLRYFVSEIIYNAQKHGHADSCNIKITKNTMRVTDTGIRFNPMDLGNPPPKGGGGYALLFLQEEFPSMKTKYSFRNNTNTLTIIFDTDVFDVNSMCEAEIPDLCFDIQPIMLYEGKSKYCYADICKSLEYLNNIFNISGLMNIIRFGVEMIEKHVFEKFFIYFSTINTPPSKELYYRLSRMIGDKTKNSIILLPENTDLNE